MEKILANSAIAGIQVSLMDVDGKLGEDDRPVASFLSLSFFSYLELGEDGWQG